MAEEENWKCNRCGAAFKTEKDVMKHIVHYHNLPCYVSFYTNLKPEED